MTVDDAKELLRSALSAPGGVWADLGAGAGTFTRALAELLGRDGRVYAVDRAANALAAVPSASGAGSAEIITVVADFTHSLGLDTLGGRPLAGVLMANALHFVADQEGTLRRIGGMLHADGRVVLVEYDRRAPSRWVPYPISPERLAGIAANAGLTAPKVVATQPSLYGGTLYAAYLTPILASPVP
jgi:ubiquinone/menaquinone biosynthesis C-methylase UbiE